MVPRALTPVGVALVDKPAGPSSFAIVAQLRRRTRARTGHTGTLDPFATGLLVLLSGAATRLAPCFVGLDKQYETTVDLTATTTTGDPEGEVVERHAAPVDADLSARLAGLTGEIELRIPAASAVKIDGRRAYALARKGIEVEMPMRKTSVHSLEVLERAGDSVTLRVHVSAGTYVRAIAQALGGHCTALRRTAVGPFEVGESAPVELVELVPVARVLERLPDAALDRVENATRAGVLALEGSTPGSAA